MAFLLKETEDVENFVSYENKITLKQCKLHCHLEKFKQKARFSGLPIFKWNDGESVYQMRHLAANCTFARRWPAREEMEKIRKNNE